MAPIKINNTEYFPTNKFNIRFDELVGEQENKEKFLKRVFREGRKEVAVFDSKIINFFHTKLNLQLVTTNKNVLITLKRIGEDE